MQTMAPCAGELTLEYPRPYTLVQRESAGGGVIPVRGRFPSDQRPSRVEARFAGGPWQVVDAQPGSNTFAGNLPAPVGQGRLEVRTAGPAAATAGVECVAVGDLFLVAGQSNADGRGAEWVRLDPANPYVGVKYRRGEWSPGGDPSANDTTNAHESASPWPIVLNQIIPSQKVPVGFIAAAVGSTVVRQWRRVDGACAAKAWSPGGMYARAREMVETATGGRPKIRAVLYYQGENDMTHWNGLSVMGDYAAYKSNLLAMVDSFWEDYQVPVLVGQLSNNGADREKNDAVRRAQQEIWREHPHALPGAVTYDIYPTDGCHFRDPARMKALAERWVAAILSGVYGRTEYAGPELKSLRRTGPRTLALTYQHPMVLGSWDGRSGTKAEGFRLADSAGVLVPCALAATRIEGGSVTLDFDRELPPGLRVHCGSGADGQDGVVLRHAANGLPAPMLFGCPAD